MNIVLKLSGGKNIVLQPMARAAYYPAREIQPAQVEVWQRPKGEPAAAARLVGRYAPGESGSFGYNPLEDRDLILSTVSIAPDGTRSVRELAEAQEYALTFQRETEAPTIGQFTDATAETVTVGVDSFSKLVRKRRLKVAEALDMGELDSPTVEVFEYENGLVPAHIEIARSGALVPDFEWSGMDPATTGFSKTGSGTTEENAGGWRINTLTTDAATYYAKSTWPASAFAGGFTLELNAPAVTTSDNASPAQCVALRIEDGSHRYELTFDASGNVALNGGTPHAIAAASITFQ